ncbi:hypothetical protein QTH47_12625 [Clostridium perfringens]|nr:hypothetical protein [Clostridium perfringens]
MKKRKKCLMNIKLLLNDDDTICFGLQETKINAKFTISKDTLTVNLEDLMFSAGMYCDKPYTFKTVSTEVIPCKYIK